METIDTSTKKTRGSYKPRTAINKTFDNALASSFKATKAENQSAKEECLNDKMKKLAGGKMRYTVRVAGEWCW